MAEILRLEEELQAALRNIPEDLADVLEIEPATFLMASARLHGLMAHWSTRMAYAKAKHAILTRAREVGLDESKLQVRHTLVRAGEKVTEDLVTSSARVLPRHMELCTQEALAEADYLHMKGLVDAIHTKREALKIIGYYIRPEMRAAEETYVMPDVNSPQMPISADIEKKLLEVQKATEELEKKTTTVIRVRKGKAGA